MGLLQDRALRLRRCRGFTLIELLVVIAVIAILLALLLPAVHQAREAARRTSCKNNLKQLALALHLYHDVHQAIPDSSYASYDRTDWWAWGTMILPYIEQGNLQDHLDLDGFPLDAQNIGLLNTPVSVFRCPTDPGPETATFTEAWTFEPVTVSLGNYGSSWYFWFWPRDSHVSFGDVADGLSNTILLPEAIVAKYPQRWFGTIHWAMNWCCDLEGFAGFDDTYFVNGSLFMVGMIPPTHPTPGGVPSSHHPGGGHIALCDGSVRFITSTGAWDETFYNLSTPDDGEVVGPY